MKHVFYGIAGILALGTALPAFATSAPASMQSRSTEVIESASSRTVVVSESKLFGQQIAAELQGEDKASTFRGLIAANGLSQTLRDDDDGYTAFVPVNSAFDGMSFPPAAPGQFNPQVRAMLDDHVVDSKFDVNLLHGQRDSIESISGKRIIVSKRGRSFYANGHLIVDRMHTPEGIYYFVETPLTSSDIGGAVYNPADASK